MKNPRNNAEPEDADAFASFFEEAEQSPAYWSELAKLEFSEEILTRLRELGMKKGELARRMGVQPAFVTRLLSGGNNFEIETMVRVARALECDFRCHLQPAGTETMWIDVLKEAPVRPTSKQKWESTNFTTVSKTTNHVYSDERLPAVP